MSVRRLFPSDLAVRSLLWAATVAVVPSVVMSGCSIDARADGRRADGAGAGVPVRVLTVHRRAERAAVRASGVTEARTSSDIAFQVGGKVVAVGVDEGTAVRAGQFLAQIDRTDYRLALETADLAHRRAADELARAEALRSSRSIAPNDFDKAQTAAQQSAVARDVAAKRLADARLVAPFSGVVARKAIERGATAAVGTTVFSIVDLDEIDVRVGVPESEISSLHVNAPATVIIAGVPGRNFTGRVKVVGVVADPTTRTYTVKIAVPNPSRMIKAGMVAEAVVDAVGEASVIRVPGSAINRDAQGAPTVYVYDATDHHVHERAVEPGDVAGSGVEIRRGLSDGDAVVVAGQSNVRDGVAVDAAWASSDAALRQAIEGRDRP